MSFGKRAGAIIPTKVISLKTFADNNLELKVRWFEMCFRGLDVTMRDKPAYWPNILLWFEST